MINKCWLILLLLLPLLSLSLLFTATISNQNRRSDTTTLPNPPKLAYLITGSIGDGHRLKRLLLAVYHPWNLYLLHLDRSADPEERADLDRFLVSEPVFGKYKNVRLARDADAVTKKGPTEIASVLHGIAILLSETKDWSWFVNLSAEDYPLMSQDDLLHIFSYLPRDLNFIEHTSNLGWREYQRARPIVVDPALYGSRKSDVSWAKEKRSLPSSFKLFVGSSSVVLTRSFLEFCIWGWDNLPRTVLMYYTNFLLSIEGYFHTVICNSMDFQNTTVNNDLRFTVWDNPPGQYPLNLTEKHFDLMADSGAPFARTFVKDDPVLDRIDSELLKRRGGKFTPGGWYNRKFISGAGNDIFFADYQDVNVLRPSASSKKLGKLLAELLDAEEFRAGQCK